MRKQFWKQMRTMSLGSGVPSRLKSKSVKRLKLCVSSSKLSELRLPDKALKHTCKRKLITADGIANKMSISSPVHRLLFAVCVRRYRQGRSASSRITRFVSRYVPRFGNHQLWFMACRSNKKAVVPASKPVFECLLRFVFF